MTDSSRIEIPSVARPSGRTADALRPIALEIDVNKYAEGSCLAKFGDTHVHLHRQSIEERGAAVDPAHSAARGWVTAEYGMLPRATNTRDRPRSGPRQAEAAARRRFSV